MKEDYLELSKKIISLYSTESKEEFESKFITEVDSFISKIVTPMMKPLYSQINHQQKIIGDLNFELGRMKDKFEYFEDNAMNGTDTFNI
jgi:hypothetical protein